MTVKKRGLSRGLEALLKNDATDLEKSAQELSATALNSQALARVINLRTTESNTSAQTLPLVSLMSEKDIKMPSIDDVAAQSALVLALFEHIRKENLMLLEEAEALKRLIEEFETMIGHL